MEDNNFSIQGLIDEHVMKEQSERVEKKMTSWHASGLGSCMTGRYLARKGEILNEPYDPRTLRVFKIGKKLEDWFIELLNERTDIETKMQGRVEWKEMDLTGYYDLYVKKGDKELIYELKTRNSRAFWWMIKKGEGPNIQHVKQLWTYLNFYKVNEGRLLYIEKDTLTTAEFPVFLNNEQIRKEVIDELTLLNSAWKAQLPPEPVRDPKDWRYKYCSFHLHCLKQPEYYIIK